MRAIILLTLLTALIPQYSEAQDTQQRMVPETAIAVIRVKAPATTLPELAAFVDKVQPGYGELARGQLRTTLLNAVSNPSLSGLDQSRDWYFAIFMGAERQTDTIPVIPVTDAAKAKAAMGPDFQFVEKDGWIAFSTDSVHLAEISRCVAGDLRPIANLVDDRSEAAMQDGQLCVFVNGAAIKTAFAEELAKADQQLDDALRTIAEQVSQTNPGMPITQVLEFYRVLGAAVLQAARDSDSAVLSVRITDVAIQVEELLTVKADSETDKFFRSQPVGEMASLKSVPEGLSLYAAFHGDPSVFFDWGEQLISKLFKETELAVKMKKSMALMRTAKFGTMAAGMDLVPDQAGAARYLALNEISPPSVVQQAFREFGSGIEYEIAGIRQKLTYESAAETIDGTSVDLYKVEQSFDAQLDPLGLQKAMTEKMYGPGGITQRIAIKGDLLLITMGGGTDTMQQLMQSSQWTDSKLLAARARQHQKANLLILIDGPNLLKKFAQMILDAGVIPVPVTSDQLNELKPESSYAGFSIALEKQRLHARTVIPVETIRGFVQTGRYVQQLIQNPR